MLTSRARNKVKKATWSISRYQAWTYDLRRSWRLEGSEVHAFGPAWEKARSPNLSFSFGLKKQAEEQQAKEISKNRKEMSRSHHLSSTFEGRTGTLAGCFPFSCKFRCSDSNWDTRRAVRCCKSHFCRNIRWCIGTVRLWGGWRTQH